MKLQKTAKITLISAFQWWDGILSQYDINPREQLLMFHLIRHFNKNFWAPAQISINLLSAIMHSDKRTVKKALESVISRGWIIKTKNGYILNTDYVADDEIDDSPVESTENLTENLGDEINEVTRFGELPNLAKLLDTGLN